ncbi:hypothetical protein MJO28_010992 [Puccinia striiformis f. sp. tritici]|uniref:Uncharacterized protein n=1 Tax=Puccinia striiformis f. sp. tritici TaxID=168172 RepID=A0ACC0E2G6_9BASI|nr:hypothetical protein MJO28_010992 [Puccinia striiformis f. sp. tritici]
MNSASMTATISNPSPSSLRSHPRTNGMSTDHHNYQPGPTLPPLRPFSFPSNHPSAAQFSHHSVPHSLNRPAQSASPIPQSTRSSQSPSAPSANRASLHNSYHPYQHSKVSPRQDRGQVKQHNPPVSQYAVDSRNDQPARPKAQGNVHGTAQAHLSPAVSNYNLHHQQLKRTASRAELDRQSPRGREEFVHSEAPPPLPTDQNKSKHEHPKSNSQAAHDKEVFVKPEYLTPHLSSQPLPPQATHSPTVARSNSSGSGGVVLSPCSPHDSDGQPPHPPRHGPVVNPPTSQQDPDSIARTNSIKKRRMTITNEGMLLKPRNGHASLTSSNQSSSSPDPRTAGRNSISKHNAPELYKDPIGPLVIGFIQPQHPSAMQQVADTIKLRDEQKRLIEQRRNSFAGQSSLNSFSFNGSSNHNPPPSIAPPAPPSQESQYSPRSARSNRARTSISKPIPQMINNPHQNGPMNSHGHPTHPSSLSINRHPRQSLYAPPAPTANLSPIDEAATRRRNSIIHQQHQGAPTQAVTNHPTDHQATHSPPPSSSTSPKHCLSPGAGPTIASRRGQEVEEKVKNLALATQAFQAHLLEQPSVKSAPIRSGFLQATAPNGDVVTTPLIARQNQSGRPGSTGEVHGPEFQHPFPTKYHPQPSNLRHEPKQLSRPSHAAVAGPTHHNLAPPSYGKGLERRKTMHADSLVQVPTLNHLMNKPGQTHGQHGHGSVPLASSKLINPNEHQLHQASSMSGPVRPRPIYTNPHHPHHQHQDNMNGLRGAGQQNHPHGPSGAPLQANHQFQQHHLSQNSPSNSSHSWQGPRSRHSVGSASSAGIPPRHMFLQLFETFYDSLSDCKILQSNLEDHDRRSSQLLNLLQSSSGVFERMLEDRMATMQKEFTRDIQVLEGRIERLEARNSSNDSSMYDDRDTNPDKESTLKSPGASLSKNLSHPEDQSLRRSTSRSSASGSGSAGEDRSITSRLDKLEQDMISSKTTT